MIYLIKSKNSFGRFYRDVYIIEYQKQSFPYIYLFIFLHLANQFFEISQIDKIIFAKLPIVEINLNRELARIVTLVMLYSLYKNTNSHLFYMNSTQNDFSKYVKYYFCNFFEKTAFQENGYSLY